MIKTKNIEPLVNRLIENNWVHKNAEIISLMKDCALVKIFTGKAYSYRVVNVISGDNKYLFHRRTPISNELLGSIETKIKEYSFYDVEYPKTGDDMIRFIFEKVFHGFGYTIRTEQIDLSMQMYEAILARRISLSDVPVGLGKTHAYLVAGIVYRLFLKEEKLIKLRQGVGRLIRKETDSGVISILDARASGDSKYYGEVLKALLKCRMAETEEDIKTFLKEKKDKEFFD